MGLGIYTTATPGGILSTGGALTSPLAHTIDGRVGGTREQKLYVRNDDALYSFSGVNVKPVDTSGSSIIDGAVGYSWKLRVGDTQPTTEEWNDIDDANTITIGDIGTLILTNTSTYYPFWVRIAVPRNAPVRMHTDVILQLNATAILI